VAADRTPAGPAAVPFGALWAPLARAAHARARRAAPRRAHARLTAEAHAELRRALLDRLAAAAARACFRAFAASGACRPDRYRAFVCGQLGAGRPALLDAYPVLDRHARGLAGDWVRSTAELLVRLDADAAAVGGLAGGGALGRIARVDACRSDPHGGGRHVAVLYPRGGAPVVYKPRSLALDVAYATLVAWLDGVLPPDAPRPRAVRVVDRGTHGWAEYVAPAACADAAALARYYERAGAALCLAHVLRGTDLHAGNVIAAGEHPMLVDLETLATPVPAEGAHALGRLEPCVLDVGLLPQVRVDGGGAGRVEAGVGVAAARGRGAPRAARAAGWVDANTDAMRWGEWVESCGPGAHEPTVRGAPNGPPGVDVGACVARGFRRAYRALRAHRDALLAPDGPLAPLAAGETRVLLRGTSTYAVLLARTSHPDFLADEAVHAAELNVLRRPYERPGAGPPPAFGAAFGPVLDAEHAALQRRDVPHFTVPTAGRDLHAAGQGVVLANYAARSGVDAVQAEVAALGPRRLARQLHHIRIAFAADAHRDAVPYAGEPLGEAARLAGLLRAVAVRRGAAASWQRQDVAGGQRRLTPVGPSLESGQAGIALFLAAHARVLQAGGRVGEADEAGSWARAALAPVRAWIAREGHRRSRRVGLAVGWGGVAYALASAGRLLGDADLLEVARGVPAPPAPGRHAGADVFGGAAGAILGALAVHEATGCARALAVAAEWGRWVSADGRTHVAGDGFGHGPAGVAAALLRLAMRTGEPQFAAAATLAALAATPDGGRSPDGWCAGGTGRGLALVAALAAGAPAGVEAAATWRAELARLARAAAGSDAPPWTLCCGALARVDLLLSAGAVLGEPALAVSARALCDRLLAHARRRLSYAHPPHLEALVPGLLRGVAGVGYTWLRATSPALVPSVLVAEVPASEPTASGGAAE
jgi:type 2 lantibiotic biosynthesis protein LanM